MDKTDASELSPETADPDEIVRARFAVLRDSMLAAAESLLALDLEKQVKASGFPARMSTVAHIVTAAAHANNVLRLHSVEQIEKQKLGEMNEYFGNFMGVLRAMETSNEQRFAQQREWVERELKARGMEPPKNAKVLSLVPNDGQPEPEPAG